MTIAFGTIGAKSAGVTASPVSVPQPASTAGGDIEVAGRIGWNNAITFTDEAGWTSRGDAFGGTGSAADNHTSGARTDTRELFGGETGNIAFDLGGTISGCLGIMARYTKALGKLWAVAVSGGDDNTHAANRSIASGTTIDLAPGDMVVAVVAVDTDTALTITSPAFTASGITFGTTTRRTSGAGVTSGNDGNVEVFDAVVSSGSGTVNVTLAFTTATSQCGPAHFLRLREVAPAGPTITAFETADWTGTGATKSITVAGAVNGDQILVMFGGDNGTGGSNVSAASVSTTAGSTGSWTEPEEGLAAGSQAWASSSTATVTADGDVTVQLARTQSTGLLWGGFALLAHNHGGIGVHARSAPSATETVSLTVEQNSAVGVIVIDWDALAAVGFSTAGGNVNEIQRAQAGAGPDLTDYAAVYMDQAAGTFSYGIGTSPSTNLHVIAIEIKAAAAGTPALPPAGMSVLQAVNRAATF